MKKIYISLFILFSSFIFSNYVYADDTLVLDKPVIQFKKIKNYTLQGYSVVKDKLFIVLVSNDDSRSIIKVYDLNNYKEILSYEYGSLGHANDVTYNSKTNLIYVLASSGSDEVFTFNGDTFYYQGSFNIGLPVRSITYINDLDKYAVRTVSTGFIYNKNFKLNNKLPFIVGMNFSTELGRQGWTYYNELIYYANWSWVRLGGDGANIIYVYNLEGKKISNIYTSNDIGEIEGVDFYNNKMILGFNGYDNTIKFYLSNIPEIENIVEEEEVLEETKIVKKKNYELYIFLGIAILVIVIVLVIILRHKKKVIK